jgi:hypothetical protein
MISLLTLAAAFAGTYTVETKPIPIVSTVGLPSPNTDLFYTVESCILGVECFHASDAPWTGSVVDSATGVVWPFATGELRLSEDASSLEVVVHLNPPSDGAGFDTWPTTWPASITMSRTFPDGVHSVKVPLAPAVDGEETVFMRYKVGETNNTVLSLTGTKALTVEAPFTTKGWRFKLPAGTYTMQVPEVGSEMYTAATGGSIVSEAFCGIIQAGGTSWLEVGIEDTMPDLNRSSAGRGTVYCRFKQNGVSKAKAFSVTVQ